MAKKGEGDPRWIVEERPDATNVNNWHWSEKNATQWSKDRLRALLVGLEVEHDQYAFTVTDLTSCEGEATANNRKKKLIFFYEWVIKGEWRGSLPDSDDYKGKFEVTNLSEENGVEDLEVLISMEDTSADAIKLKEHMHKKGTKVIIQKLGQYIEDLKSEFSEGLILPDVTGAAPTVGKPDGGHNDMKRQMNDVVETTATKFNQPLKTKKVTMQVELMCEAPDIFRVLTDEQMVRAFTRNEVELSAAVGGRFSLFSGNVEGSFTSLEQNKKLVMRWRASDWPREHYSTVTISLRQKDCTTELSLTQTGVPDQHYDKTVEGWHRYYWEPIKQTFGYGSSLY